MVGGLSGGDFIRACSMEHPSLIWGLVNQRWPDGISSLEEKLSSDNVRCGRGCYTTNQYKVYSGIGIACIGFITGAGGWQPPAALWNIICHLDSHKLIVIAGWKSQHRGYHRLCVIDAISEKGSNVSFEAKLIVIRWGESIIHLCCRGCLSSF